MTAHRQYHFDLTGSQDVEAIQAHLKARCEQFWWYTDPYVQTQDPGIGFGFTVAARDQWWCHRRAIFLATEVCEVLRLSLGSMSVPVWTALAPHTNRGYAPYRTP
jgi:hypothetical protein